MTETGTGQAAEGAGPGLDPGTWRLAVVAGVRMDMPGEYPEVLVHEAVAPWRELAIPVGMAEGNAIAYAWRGLPTPRPLTHALFTDVLERHQVQLEAVRITARRGRSFFAELDTVGPNGRQVITCRPSDALALVLRQRMPTPVLVADWVFDPEDPDPEDPDPEDPDPEDPDPEDSGVPDRVDAQDETGSDPGSEVSTIDPALEEPPTTDTVNEGPSPDEAATDEAATDGPGT